MATADQMTRTGAKLLATLKAHAPHKVRAFAGDDDSRDIAVPTRRKKWSQVISNIEARSWTRVELLDSKGAVLAYVDNAEPAGDVEDIVEGKAAKTRSEAEWIVRLVKDSMRDAMQFRDNEMREVLAAQRDIAREMGSAFHGIANLYRAQVDVARETENMKAAAAVAQATGQGDGFKELMDALPQLLQLLPALKTMLGSGQAPQQPRLKNGA